MMPAGALMRSLLLSRRMDGLGVTVRRAWARLFGHEEWLVFVRHLEAPKERVVLPATINDVLVRRMSEKDVDAVARVMPFELDRRSPSERRERIRRRVQDGFVALRCGQIVGAAWYIDAVTPEQPWYDAVKEHLLASARFTANVFVLAGERAASWALSKQANDWLASNGVRTIVGLILEENRSSILLSRMLGGRIVARQSICYRFGRRTMEVTPVSDQAPFGRR